MRTTARAALALAVVALALGVSFMAVGDGDGDSNRAEVDATLGTSLIDSPATTTGQGDADEAAESESAALADLLGGLTWTADTRSGLVVVDLATGASASLGASTSLSSASLYKLFVAYGVLAQVDAGTRELDEVVGSTGLDVATCLERSITVSDNPCGEGLGTLIGWTALDATLAAEGYAGTDLDRSTPGATRQTTTAGDVALLLERLVDGDLLSTTSTDLLLGWLAGQQLNDEIPAGLPEGTEVAHKTGRLDDCVHDAGIVSAPEGDYLVVAMTCGWANPSSSGSAAIAELSAQLWSYFTTQRS